MNKRVRDANVSKARSLRAQKRLNEATGVLVCCGGVTLSCRPLAYQQEIRCNLW